VGWDTAYNENRDPNKIHTAIKVMSEHLKPGGKLVATLPLGYNANLDAELNSGKKLFDEQYYFTRNSLGSWVQVQEPILKSYLFRDGIARSLLVGITTGS
jgi:hypothetical protein